MAWQTYTAGEDLTGKKGYAIEVNAGTGKVHVAGGGEASIGLLRTEGVADANVSVFTSGREKAQIGSAVKAGHYLTPDAAGKLRTVAALDGAHVVAVAEVAAAADTEVYVNVSPIGALASQRPVDASGNPLVALPGPKGGDGESLIGFAPAVAPDGTSFEHICTGVADDLANGTPFGGAKFRMKSIIVETQTVDFRFIEDTQIKDGCFWWSGGDYADEFDFSIVAPACPSVNNVGTGAYEKVAYLGGYRYAPKADDDWDLDLVSKENANVDFTKVIPVANPDLTGHFDFDPATGLVTDNGSMRGTHDLLDYEHTVVRLLASLSLWPAGEMSLPAVRRIHPQYLYRATLNNVSGKNLYISWMLQLGRVAGY